MRQYLKLLEKTLKEGTKKPDRTGIGTRSIFAPQMRFEEMGKLGSDNGSEYLAVMKILYRLGMVLLCMVLVHGVCGTLKVGLDAVSE